MEQLRNVEAVLGWSLKEIEAEFFGEVLALLGWDYFIFFFVALVANEDLRDIFRCMGVDLFNPVSDIVKGGFVGTVIN